MSWDTPWVQSHNNRIVLIWVRAIKIKSRRCSLRGLDQLCSDYENSWWELTFWHMNSNKLIVRGKMICIQLIIIFFKESIYNQSKK